MRIWLRGDEGAFGITATGHVNLQKVYANDVQGTAQGPFSKQKVTVVATHLFGITDTEDLFEVHLAVVHESITPTYTDPPAEFDPRLKGAYTFARGPILYSPKRLISVPTDHELYVIWGKLQGSNASDFRLRWQFLLNVNQS